MVLSSFINKRQPERFCTVVIDLRENFSSIIIIFFKIPKPVLNTSYLNYCNFHYFQWSYSWKGWLLRKICALRASTDSLHKQHCMHVVSTFVHFTFNRWSSQELERTVRSCLYLTEWLKSIRTIHILNKNSGFFLL